jgi:hypothetical protein
MMKQLAGIQIAAVLVVALLASPGVIAQSEKVSVRMAPRPDQTVRQTSVTEMDFDISADGAAAAPGFMPLKMAMRMTTTITLKTGTLKPDGTLDTELTYDQLRVEMSMNGQTMPADVGNPLAGRTIVMTYNRAGEVVGVQGLEAAGLTDNAFRQMMGSFFGELPVTALAVGETTTGPLNFMLPLPLPGAAPAKMVGQTQLKLVSIDNDARGRAATFESTMAGKMVSDLASPDGKGKMSFELNLSGQGTYVLNLETGIVRSNVGTSSVIGTISMAGGTVPPARPGMTMRGTVRMTMTGD